MISSEDQEKGSINMNGGVEVAELNNNNERRSKSLLVSRTTLLLAATSIGIIYGDLGTSPIYTVNGIFPAGTDPPSAEDVIGAISAILWSLTLLPLLKYAIIALQFGNGSAEGGPMALYGALYPPDVDSDKNRTLTTFPTFSSQLHQPSMSFFENSWVKKSLLAWVLFGTGLTISDGMLTPAVSVVSAVGGIAVAAPGVANSTVPIAIAILVVLFLFQALGTQRVGFVFAPILATFLIIIAVSGMINVASHPGIFRAIDPSRAIMWFVRTKNYDNLAGVILSVTGCEAMFANLGQFSKQSIRLGFISFVYPCLVFAYLGQGARLIEDGANVLPNVFFNSIPGGINSGFFWFTFVFTILAAIIASQAMISATFSLIQQLVTLRSMPSIKIIHTSSYFSGQVFVPVANILLALGSIGFAAGFGTGPGLTNAYGFAVSTVFIVTTSFIALSIVRIKHLPVWVAVAFLIGAGFVDSLFWGAALKKVPEGAYVPLAIGILITGFLLFWNWAKGLEDSFDSHNRHRITDIIRKIDSVVVENEDVEPEVVEKEELVSGGLRLRLPKKVNDHNNTSTVITDGDKLQLVDGNVPLTRLPIFSIFHNQSGNTLDGTPHSFACFLRCYPSIPQVVVFLSILVVSKAYVTDDENRYVVSKVRSFDGVYIAKLFVGYRDVVNLRNISGPIFEAIKGIERSSGEDGTEEKIAAIENAMAQSVTHMVPHFHVTAKPIHNKILNYFRRFLIEGVYRRLQSDETDTYVLEEEEVLRVGVTAAL